MFDSIGSTELAVNVCVPMTVRFAIHEGLKCYIIVVILLCPTLYFTWQKSTTTCDHQPIGHQAMQ